MQSLHREELSMQKLQAQLKNVSKSLATLSKQVESISKQLKKTAPAKKTAPVKKAAPAKKSRPAKKVAPARKPAAKKASPAGGKTVLDSVLEVIKRSKKGATIAQLKARTKLEARQLSNALYKLAKKGHIRAHSRGLYVKK